MTTSERTFRVFMGDPAVPPAWVGADQGGLGWRDARALLAGWLATWLFSERQDRTPNPACLEQARQGLAQLAKLAYPEPFEVCTDTECYRLTPEPAARWPVRGGDGAAAGSHLAQA